MGAFSVGETVTYYPVKKSEDDNRHWPAEVLEERGNRYRVKIYTPPEPIVRTVTARRLARQLSLIES